MQSISLSPLQIGQSVFNVCCWAQHFRAACKDCTATLALRPALHSSKYRHTKSINVLQVDGSSSFSMERRWSSCTVHDGYGAACWRTVHSIWICIIMTRPLLHANEVLTKHDQVQLTVGGDMPRSAGCYLTFFSYKQVSKQLVKSLSNHENVDNFTTLYTSYLRFSLVQIWCTLSPVLTRFLFLYWLFSSILCCLSSGSKAAAGIIDHAQIA